MVWPFPNNTNITTAWDDPRPVSNPGEHMHGALDIGTPIGSSIIAPERGTLFLYKATRHEGQDKYWPNSEMVGFPFKNYFYDMFGGIVVLKGDSGMTHVFAHLYMNTMYNKTDRAWQYVEQKADKRFAISAMITEAQEVFVGAEIGVTGNSGYSFGPHCHYEIHDGFRWQNWDDRIDPETIEWEEFK